MYNKWVNNKKLGKTEVRSLFCTKNEVYHLGFLHQMWQNPQKTVDLVTFTAEILNGKLHFLCNVCCTDQFSWSIFEEKRDYVDQFDNMSFKEQYWPTTWNNWHMGKSIGYRILGCKHAVCTLKLFSVQTIELVVL